MGFIVCIDCGTTVPGAAQKRRCERCRKAWNRRRSVRTLAPGETLPAGEPLRRIAQHGYVELRWKVDTRSYVRIYEHQVTNGRVTTAEQVHHVNRVKHDNRPENLRHLSEAEHAAEHNDVAWWAEADRLYTAGLGTYRIARIVGRHPVTVWRGLVKFGTRLRRNDPATAPIRRWRQP